MKSPVKKVTFIGEMQPPETQKRKIPAAKWLKRFGVAGFMFFLIKGLIWLALFVGAAYFGFGLFK